MNPRRLLRSRYTRLAALAGLLLAAGGVLFVGPGRVAGMAAKGSEQLRVLAARTMRFDLQPAEQVALGEQRALGVVPPAAYPPISSPLRVHPTNSRYFADGAGRPVYLAGSHTWLNLQDAAIDGEPGSFDYTGWLDFLAARGHNFFRLWMWEQTGSVVERPVPYAFTPNIYQRTGPGTANDGAPKLDVTKFNDAYFQRLRARVIEAGQRGIYVSIMLFDGWSTDYPKGPFNQGNPWATHPFNPQNNINGIDGDKDNDNSGDETHSLDIPEVTALQEAYVRKVIDSVNDLDNVLYEISNESHGGSHAWQYHMIELIKSYEAQKPKQHPVGMTVAYPDGSNDALFNSPADWISPNGSVDDRPAASGAKVIVADTDHLCGICGSRAWVWKSFTMGENPLFMDQYDDLYKLDGGGYNPANENDVSLRQNLGYTRSYAQRMNLAASVPHPELASSGYCLANPAPSGAEYLIYLPQGGSVTVDLSATAGPLQIEWLNPQSGEVIVGTTSGGGNRSFPAPFGGDAVLYIYQQGQAPTPSATPDPSATPAPSATPVVRSGHSMYLSLIRS